MKLIIDIPEDIYTSIKNGMRYKDDVKYVMDKIEQCIPISDNATNGDMIKALFADNFTIDEYLNDTRGLIGEVHLRKRNERDLLAQFDKDLWNAPYKRGDTECIKWLPTAENKGEDRPKGHWIMKHRTHNEIKHYTGQDEMGETHTISVLERYEADEPYCSECGKRAGDTSQNYCCACGAKMIDPQESEEA